MESGDQQLPVTTIQMVGVIKEAPPTMAGRAWRMTLWAWEVEGQEEEATPWEMSLEAGVAQEEVKEAEKALEDVPAQTETRKEGTEKKQSRLQCCRSCPGMMWIQGFCPTLDGDRRPLGSTPPGMSILLTVSSRVVPEGMIGSQTVEALAGAQQHQQHLPSPLEVGVVGRAQVQEALAGESSQPLDGTANPQQQQELDRVAGMMDPATKLAATAAVTPGATTSTKTTGPTLGLMPPNRSRAGAQTVEVRAGVLVDQGEATTGGSPRKVQAQWVGTATATARALDVGVSQAGPTPAAATLGLGVEDQILLTRALQTQVPTGVT